MALVLSHMKGTWEHSSPKSLNVYVIQSNCEQQLAAKTYSASVVDWATVDCLRRSQKLISTRSRFPINSTPCKVGIRKTKKRKERGRWVPKTELRSVSKIPEDPLDGLLMWSPRWCLNIGAQKHRKLDVQHHYRQVQEGADHAPVLLLVHRRFVLVRVERCSRTHQCQQGLWVIHIELLEDAIRVIGLMHKGSFLRLLDL
jgi:hypothetical protein